MLERKSGIVEGAPVMVTATAAAFVRSWDALHHWRYMEIKYYVHATYMGLKYWEKWDLYDETG